MVGVILACPLPLIAQYGLGFASHETVQDQRTGLDLSDSKKICYDGNIELSFDLSFMPNRSDYFGYVVRIIVDDKTNIDLLYDRLDNVEKHFKIVLGDKFSTIAFNIDSNKLFQEWVPIRIRLDADSKSLKVTCGDEVFTETLAIDNRGCLKALFGYNNYKEFITTDVPAMKIRNVQVQQDERLLHHWPLDDEYGTEVKDVVNGMTATIWNPQWIKRRHHEWGLLEDSQIGGQASAAFDPLTENIFIVGRDSLLRIHVPTGERQTFKYASGPLFLINGNQSYFDTVQNQLLNICIDQQTIAAFDFETLTWSTNFIYPGVGTSYLHFNKFYSPVDSNLYFIGGYGHFLFKNSIQQYSRNGMWQAIDVSGDSLIPRYLAALGATSEGAYILGGYGSASGQQMLNPRNLYDLLYFDVKNRTLSKKYELSPGEDDFVWANSLVIDEAADQFYGLMFPKHKFNGNLQLVAGSLSQPQLTKLGVPIPYLFHDIRSFSDLYYCPISKRFAAVTLYYDEKDVTAVKIYSLFGPPLPYNETLANPQTGGLIRYILYIGLCIIGVAVLYTLYISARRKRLNSRIQPAPPQPIVTPKKEEHNNSIFLFGGDLQLFDTEGTDMTRSFTPLIKELFLVVLLHTIRWGRGISSEKLTEQFWFDKSAESARNNRSVNIAKINTILERLGRAKISKETGYWRFDADTDIYIDYKSYLAIVTNKEALDKERIKELSGIVQRGGFLSETDYDWLDSFKAEVSIQVINTCMRFAENVRIAEDPEFMVELANYVFYFDPVHEEAMIIKCKALAYMGNHSLATQTFENFCNEYRHIYGEEFGKDYKTILS